MIHTYTLFDKNIVLDVNSGAVFEFDGLAFDLLSRLKGAEQPPVECPEDISVSYTHLITANGGPVYCQWKSVNRTLALLEQERIK